MVREHGPTSRALLERFSTVVVRLDLPRKFTLYSDGPRHVSVRGSPPPTHTHPHTRFTLEHAVQILRHGACRRCWRWCNGFRRFFLSSGLVCASVNPSCLITSVVRFSVIPCSSTLAPKHHADIVLHSVVRHLGLPHISLSPA